jgi:hypothetical protein
MDCPNCVHIYVRDKSGRKLLRILSYNAEALTAFIHEEIHKNIDVVDLPDSDMKIKRVVLYDMLRDGNVKIGGSILAFTDETEKLIVVTGN